jgi:hypothetical protein
MSPLPAIPASLVPTNDPELLPASAPDDPLDDPGLEPELELEGVPESGPVDPLEELGPEPEAEPELDEPLRDPGVAPEELEDPVEEPEAGIPPEDDPCQPLSDELESQAGSSTAATKTAMQEKIRTTNIFMGSSWGSIHVGSKGIAPQNRSMDKWVQSMEWTTFGWEPIDGARFWAVAARFEAVPPLDSLRSSSMLMIEPAVGRPSALQQWRLARESVMPSSPTPSRYGARLSGPGARVRPGRNGYAPRRKWSLEPAGTAREKKDGVRASRSRQGLRLRLA